jgi:ATP-dependent DNA helicase RecG
MSLFENPTVEDILREKEGQLFERKSARIDPRDLANHFVAFANADGGFIALGVEQDGTVTGLSDYETKINAFLQAAWDLCVPPVIIVHNFVDCIKRSH